MKRMGTRNIFSLGLIKPGSHMWLMLNLSQLAGLPAAGLSLRFLVAR